jgi:small-conductance mechanosensitive channel
MNSFEYLSDWLSENPIILSLIKYFLWVLIIVLVIQLIRRFLKRKLPDNTTRYKSQKGVEIMGYFLIVILSASYFTGSIKDFTLAIGLFSAGVAFALQELFLAVAGSIYIFIIKVYKVGERIEINGIKGDIIDIDSMYTTLMEIGEWVSSDNYSGRIVKISNAFVFKVPVYNYSRDFPFIWDEFDLPVHYDSDIEMAKNIMIRIASEELSEFSEKSRTRWKNIVNKYYIEDAELAPTLSLTMTDNWINLNLRYIVDYKKRRITKNMLQEKINASIRKSEGKVVVASTTMEIIKIPKIGVQLKKDG